MKKYTFAKAFSIYGFLALSSCGFFIHPNPPARESEDSLSPISLAADRQGKTLYIADATARRVTVLDAASHTVKSTIPLKENPSGLALAPNGSRLYVATGSAEGRIEVVDPARNRVVKSIPVGHTPCAPVITPDGRKLFVCNRFNNNVSVVDLFRGREIARIPMLREPIAADITPDGRYLFVANHLPSGNVIYEYVRDAQILMIGSFTAQRSYGGKKVDYAASGVVLVVDTSSHRLVQLIPIRDGATGLRGVCVSPDGQNVYVTHLLANYKVPTAHIEHGGINANALSIIDVPHLKLQNTVLLDDPDRGAANPWDVKCTPDGKFICVTHAGTHEISLIDRDALHRKLDEAKTAFGDSSLSYVSRDLTFLSGLRKRIPLAGEGPRGMAVTETKIYTAEYFSDSVGVIDLESSVTAAGRDQTGGNQPANGDNQSTNGDCRTNAADHHTNTADRHANTADRHAELVSASAPRSRSIALAPSRPPTETRKGELYFNDARLCFQGWQSCASCHPDGRTDGLNWDMLNDGVGNPKQTKSLLYSHRTPPSMITGIRADAETAVRAGIKHIYFTDQPEAVAVAMDAWLKSLRPVPSPYLQKGKLSKEARRGKKYFQRAGCGECHTPPLYTDLKKYDVGLGIDPEKNRAFDTPTLIEVWRTAPFLYDGRAETMYEVFNDFNKSDMHGVVSKIRKQYLFDLADYVMSL